jgi:gas vesicle protein
MFGLLRATLRAFAVGAAVGILFAPRPGTETRRMLNERISSFLNQILEVAALPPIQPERAATNGHAERAPTKRTRAAGTDARTSS